MNCKTVKPKPLLPEEIEWDKQQNWTQAESNIRKQCEAHQIGIPSTLTNFYEAFASYIENECEISSNRSKHKKWLKDSNYATSLLIVFAESIAMEFFKAMENAM